MVKLLESSPIRALEPHPGPLYLTSDVSSRISLAFTHLIALPIDGEEDMSMEA